MMFMFLHVAFHRGLSQATASMMICLLFRRFESPADAVIVSGTVIGGARHDIVWNGDVTFISLGEGITRTVVVVVLWGAVF